MSIEANEERLANFPGATKYLLDSSAVIILDKLGERIDLDVLAKLRQIPRIALFWTNDVALELMRGGMDSFRLDMLNAEGAMDPKRKENRFIIKDERGELGAVQMNAISTADYGQVLMCQNHPSLHLVTNDEKQLKCACALIHERAIGLPTFVDQLASLAPDDREIGALAAVCEQLGTRKPVTSRWIINEAD